MDNEIVIARYAEDVDWVANIPAEFAVTIYNKGQPLPDGPATRRADAVIPLKNAGRESDTFLRHILGKRQYGTGHTVFLQGDPFEHSPDILKLLAQRVHWRDVQPLSWQWIGAMGLPPSSLLERETTHFLDGGRVRPETFSLLTWGPMQFHDEGAQRIGGVYRRLHDLPRFGNIAGHFLRLCEFTEAADAADQHLAGRFAYGAMFAVRQERLAHLPRRSLEYAIEAASSHFMYGYILERLWLHLFGEAFLLPVLAPAPAMPAAGPSRFIPPAAPETVPEKVVRVLKKRVYAWAQA